jgi:hypothetical protein
MVSRKIGRQAGRTGRVKEKGEKEATEREKRREEKEKNAGSMWHREIQRGAGIYCKNGEQEEGKREKGGLNAKMKVREKKGEGGMEKKESIN